MATVIAGSGVALRVGGAARKLSKDWRSGRGRCSCSGDCGSRGRCTSGRRRRSKPGGARIGCRVPPRRIKGDEAA